MTIGSSRNAPGTGSCLTFGNPALRVDLECPVDWMNQLSSGIVARCPRSSIMRLPARCTEWIAAWTSGNLERILAHSTDDFEMRSPLIADHGFSPTGAGCF
jgi:hypothetical protein